MKYWEKVTQLLLLLVLLLEIIIGNDIIIIIIIIDIIDIIEEVIIIIESQWPMTDEDIVWNGQYYYWRSIGIDYYWYYYCEW